MEKRRHNLYDVSSLVMILVRFLKDLNTIGRTLTLSTAQNIKPSNATPQSTCSSTTVTQNLSTSQNVKPYTEKSQTTPSPTGMTQTLSTSQNIIPSNEEDEDTDKDTVYIIVVDVVTLLVVITAIVLLVYKKKRNRRRKQTGLDLVYNGNSTQTTNAPEGPGIEETHIFITQASDTLQNARDATSSNDTETQQAHSTQIIMEGKQLQGVTPNLFERLNVDKGVKTEDKYTKSHLVPRAEAYHDTYSRVSLNHSQYKSMLDTEKTDQSKQNTSNTNGHSDAFTEGEEDQSSLYDHAITGNIRTRRGNISEYSHLKDID